MPTATTRSPASPLPRREISSTPKACARRRSSGSWSPRASSAPAAASAGWFTAFAVEPVAHVRTLGLLELVFSYAVSRRLFRERLSPLELVGMGLLTLGVAIISVAG